MAQQQEPAENEYPIGRGYGHDYMRGGEVFGGYGYSERQDYERRRGEIGDQADSGQRRRGEDVSSPRETDALPPA
jgi:hypothetical protein